MTIFVIQIFDPFDLKVAVLPSIIISNLIVSIKLDVLMHLNIHPMDKLWGSNILENPTVKDEDGGAPR